MRRRLVTVGTLGLSAVLALAGVPARGGEAPLERILLAVPHAEVTADVTAAPPTAATLASRLRLADPGATVVVLLPDEAARTIGWLHVAIEPAGTDADPAAWLRTWVAGRGSLALPLTPATSEMAIVEVLGAPAGIVAWRSGDLTLTPDGFLMPVWRQPDLGTDAVALDGHWWSIGPDRLHADPSTDGGHRRMRARLARASVSGMRRLVDVSVADVTGDGSPDVALSFRRLFRRTMLNAPVPRRHWTDADGLSAHFGLYRPGDLSEIWVAGTLLRPVQDLVACPGALAVATSTLRRPAIVATNVWRWQVFGFQPLPELPGPGTPTCIDIDRDGRRDAAIIERS